MSDNLFELYSQKILALATQIPHLGALADADLNAKKRSPICGSEIEVFLKMNDDHIQNYSQIVNACALGQASAAIFGANVIGRNEEDLLKLRDELKAFLAGAGPAPIRPFEEYAVLEPAQNHRHRHASILLPVEMTLLALSQK